MTDTTVYFRAERERQKDLKRWTEDHDDHHLGGELALAAAAYALSAAGDHSLSAYTLWPWDLSGFKPTTPLRDMVKAGALLMAEIERRQRAAVRAYASDE